MKLVPTSPQIDLYNEGFGSKDLLARQPFGKQLSDLVERIEDPVVIAIDGDWGSGKSFFLKCWAGAHQIENDGTAQTIYFDAFENDFLDNPLLSLTSALSSRFAQTEEQRDIIDLVKSAAARLWRPATRIGLAIATAGATEVLGTVADAGANALNSELRQQVDAIWEKEESQRTAMNSFREALKRLSEESGSEDQPQKIVVVVDELDRCRPDYALAVLETIKHFFTVPNVHFVLGVNLTELQNSVRGRYGSGTNAESYLQKFITLKMTLPERLQIAGRSSFAAEAFFTAQVSQMDLPVDLSGEVSSGLRLIMRRDTLSLRSIERLLTEIALVPKVEISFTNKVRAYQVITANLLLIKSFYPETYKKIVSGEIELSDLEGIFGFGESSSNNELIEHSDHQDQHHRDLIQIVWRRLLLEPEEPDVMGRDDLFGTFNLRGVKWMVDEIIQDTLEKIELA
jgi:hypothetical protein